LPFRSSLLEPAACSDSTIVPAAIGYRLDEGSVADEVCYWRDMTLLPHLLNLFAKRSVQARIAFGSTQARAMRFARKEATRRLHEDVSELHAAIEEASASWQASAHQWGEENSPEVASSRVWEINVQTRCQGSVKNRPSID
jgi:hypothetical protein